MEDKDLQFLNDCSNEQLKTLIDILVYDNDGKTRYTESISNTKSYRENYPNNLKPLIPQLIDEVQRFGGNTIVNFFRRHGVPYRVVIEDVCDRLKVNYNKKLPTELLETELLKKVAVTVVEQMSEEDVKIFNSSLNKKRLLDAISNNTGSAMATIIAIVVAKFSSQVAKKGALILFGRTLSTRIVTSAVPVLNVIAALWTASDIASSAYRVTIPFTLTVAFTRMQLNAKESELKDLFA